MSTTDMLAVALDAVARGWHVFPLRPNSKKPPALHGEKDCPRSGICATTHQGWEQRAMNDPDQVRWFWTSRRYSGCNVGVATGPSGLLVVDLDSVDSPADVPTNGWKRVGVRDGHDVFAVICEEAGQPVPWETLTVDTPSGGRHLYFRAPRDVQLRNTQGATGNGLGWKVDTRSWGGYVVAPGSTTPTGRYELVEDLPVADLPTWLVHRLSPKPVTATTAAPQIASQRLPAYVDAAIRGECRHVAQAAPHEHNAVLYAASGQLGQLVGGGMLPAFQAEQALYAAATHMINGSCGCTEREIRRVIEKGLRAGQQRPRTTPANQTRRGVA
ncbi:bifunctional DNA primase/polymerase [Saccharothrix isguenensis]